MKHKVTEITVGAFGLSKKYLYLNRVERRDYAQYKNVIAYIFTEKGKRTPFQRHLTGSTPTMLLNGWQEDVNPPSGMEKTEHGMRSRFATFAPEYAEEGKAFFQKLREESTNILLDSEHDFISPALIPVVTYAKV